MKGALTEVFALALALVIRTSAAKEDTRRLGLVLVNPRLEREAMIALSPWKLDVRVVGGTRPSGVVGAELREARAIAEAAADGPGGVFR